MEISDTDARTRLLTIFEESRQEPGAPFDEQRFLDYLVKQPSKPGRVRDSFAGHRRFVRFVRKVQTEFSVYFSMKDWETNYCLDRFLERIRYLRERPEGSIRSLKNAAAQSGTNAVITVNVMLLAFMALTYNIRWLFVLIFALWLGFNGWVSWFFLRERKYEKSLLKQINELKERRADP